MNEEELRLEYDQRLPDFEIMKDEVAKSMQNRISQKKYHLIRYTVESKNSIHSWESLEKKAFKTLSRI